MLRPVPPINSHFQVTFSNAKFKNDTRFHAVQGLYAQLARHEPLREWHAHFDNLLLQRAYEPDSKLLEWCMDAINNQKIEKENLTISLLNSKHEVISSWQIHQAFPIRWGIEELHAQDTKILLESYELKYSYFEVVNSKGKIVAPKEEES